MFSSGDNIQKTLKMMTSCKIKRGSRSLGTPFNKISFTQKKISLLTSSLQPSSLLHPSSARPSSLLHPSSARPSS
jgi:hypothetical protein